MKHMNYLLLKALMAMGLVACFTVAAAQVPTRSTNGVLTDDSGMTLYVFDKDTPNGGKSMCVGQCAINWPPMMARDTDASQGDFSVITRDDGSRQWAYQGRPLYRWKNDVKPGDTTGDGVNNVWHVTK